MFEFLNKIGKSKDEFTVLELDKKSKEAVEYLEILVNRKLMQNDFKDELLNYYLNKKIDENKFFENIQKSINVLEKAEFKILSINEKIFK